MIYSFFVFFPKEISHYASGAEDDLSRSTIGRRGKGFRLNYQLSGASSNNFSSKKDAHKVKFMANLWIRVTRLVVFLSLCRGIFAEVAIFMSIH